MSTFAQMQAKIEDDLNRTDLNSQIQREINRAIRKYASMPMWFSSTTANFTTARGQWSYDTADGLPPNIRIVDYLRVNQSTPTINPTGGVANAYLLSPTPAATSYATGDVYFIKISATNTAATTIAISALATVSIVRPNDVQLQAGDVVAGQVYTIRYDSTAAGGVGGFFLQEVGGTYYDLDEAGIDLVVRRNVNDNPGLPLNYAWFDSSIYFYPIPDQVYVIQVFYEKFYTNLSSGSDSNDFTNNPETEELIEQEVEYQIYDNIILDATMAAKCKQNRNEALALCRRITTNFNSVHGAIRATTF